ncbi:MAG: hypothetical protein HY370_09080 [Proteobacteria bacterium]|nr:hypothetical protein [Pseudomonadota bacterium]
MKMRSETVAGLAAAFVLVAGMAANAAAAPAPEDYGIQNSRTDAKQNACYILADTINKHPGINHSLKGNKNFSSEYDPKPLRNIVQKACNFPDALFDKAPSFENMSKQELIPWVAGSCMTYNKGILQHPGMKEILDNDEATAALSKACSFEQPKDGSVPQQRPKTKTGLTKEEACKILEDGIRNSAINAVLFTGNEEMYPRYNGAHMKKTLQDGCGTGDELFASAPKIEKKKFRESYALVQQACLSLENAYQREEAVRALFSSKYARGALDHACTGKPEPKKP